MGNNHLQRDYKNLSSIPNQAIAYKAFHTRDREEKTREVNELKQYRQKNKSQNSKLQSQEGHNFSQEGQQCQYFV